MILRRVWTVWNSTMILCRVSTVWNSAMILRRVSMVWNSAMIFRRVLTVWNSTLKFYEESSQSFKLLKSKSLSKTFFCISYHFNNNYLKSYIIVSFKRYFLLFKKNTVLDFYSSFEVWRSFISSKWKAPEWILHIGSALCRRFANIALCIIRACPANQDAFLIDCPVKLSIDAPDDDAKYSVDETSAQRWFNTRHSLRSLSFLSCLDFYV